MKNYALESYYEDIALDAVIDFAMEQGIKLRRGDFWLFDSQEEKQKFMDSFTNESMKYRNSNRVHSVWKKDYKDGIVYVHVYYTTGKLAARVKAKVKNFLNYRFAIIHKDEVVFTFTRRDLDIIAADKDSENTQDNKQEKIMGKIAQLLKFTEENGATEAEAIAASSKVQMLLAKYHLTLADVTGESRDKESITEVTAVVDTGKKWKYTLAEVVANGYCCKTYFVGAEKIVFYGYETDTLAARRIFVYLFNMGNKLANQYVKKEREYRYNMDGVYNSFVTGFVAGVKSEFEKNCTALALIVQPEVQKSFEKFTADFKAKDLGVKIETIDDIAMREGYVEGKRALKANYLED